MLFSFTKSCKPILLLVDDNLYFTRLLTKILEAKYQVYTAANGQEALALMYRTVKPDLIISDIAMPEMDGYEFVKTLRQNGFFTHIPVCFLSDIPIHTIQRELGNTQVEAIFTKPFDPQTLLSGLEEVGKLQEHAMEG